MVTKQAHPGETVLGMPQPIFRSDFWLMFGMWVMCLKFNLNFGIGGDRGVVIVEVVHGAVGGALDGVKGECMTKENQMTPKNAALIATRQPKQCKSDCDWTHTVSCRSYYHLQLLTSLPL